MGSDWTSKSPMDRFSLTWWLVSSKPRLHVCCMPTGYNLLLLFNFVSNHSCNKHFVFWCQRLVINHSYGQSPIWMIYLLKPPFIDFPLTFPVPWTLQTLQTLQTLRHVDPQLPAPGRELGSKLCCCGRGVERRVARAKCGGLFFGISWGVQWLVGGLEHFWLSIQLGMSSSPLTHIFQRGCFSLRRH